jgi:hypothetical protein
LPKGGYGGAYMTPGGDMYYFSLLSCYEPYLTVCCVTSLHCAHNLWNYYLHALRIAKAALSLRCSGWPSMSVVRGDGRIHDFILLSLAMPYRSRYWTQGLLDTALCLCPCNISSRNSCLPALIHRWVHGQTTLVGLMLSPLSLEKCPTSAPDLYHLDVPIPLFVILHAPS